MEINYTEYFDDNNRRRVENDYLEDKDVDYFQKLSALKSSFKPYLTLPLYHGFAEIKKIPENENHIQILYSSPSSTDPNVIGHWVTSYYDKKYVYVFDSLNTKNELHTDIEKALNILYPDYMKQRKPIIFPDVQQQTHQQSKDCGVFAISFAVSLFCGIKPDYFIFDITKMRSHLLKILLTKNLEHFPGFTISIPLHMRPRHSYDLNSILNNQCLDDEHIQYFHEMLQEVSFYKPCPIFYLQRIERISQISENEKHIQILFQRGNSIGHFVCIFYDTEALYVYDSLNNIQLHDDLKQFLMKLHPYCFNGQKKPVIFKKVQSQGRTLDCGVFSIAFAVTLMFGLKPEKIQYNQMEMRKHLIKMFENRNIEHFPCDTSFIDNNFQRNTKNLAVSHFICNVTNQISNKETINRKRCNEKSVTDNLKDNSTVIFLNNDDPKAKRKKLDVNNQENLLQHNQDNYFEETTITYKTATQISNKNNNLNIHKYYEQNITDSFIYNDDKKISNYNDLQDKRKKYYEKNREKILKQQRESRLKKLKKTVENEKINHSIREEKKQLENNSYNDAVQKNLLQNMKIEFKDNNKTKKIIIHLKKSKTDCDFNIDDISSKKLSTKVDTLKDYKKKYYEKNKEKILLAQKEKRQKKSKEQNINKNKNDVKEKIRKINYYKLL